ncbi:hypothetical protein [Peribacillus frigoritolerans]|uniref:hypothetical protein n=1 Tax=Peribacillus frigoritolerans TaxID=450367 RepID=UPI003429E01A
METNGRVLVGVGKIKHISEGVEYEYEAKGGLRSMLWEHMIQHSIRPDFSEGFLLPFQEAMEYAENHQEFNPTELAVIAPEETQLEFSYATEQVSNDSAIRLLLDCVKSLERAKALGIGNQEWELQIRWVHDRINELEKIRGNYPGLGAALCAFGLEKGHFIARHIAEQVVNNNEWELVDILFRQPEKIVPQNLANTISPMLKKRWEMLQKKGHNGKLPLLQLLSRFDLTIEQATILFVEEERESLEIVISDEKLINNPYLLYEMSGKLDEPIGFWTIDFGLYPKLPTSLLPTMVKIDDPLDPKRIRALTYLLLEKAAQQGHTVLQQKECVRQIRDMPLSRVNIVK